MNSIYFVADFFAEEVLGGGELNNEEFINLARLAGFTVNKIKSTELTKEQVDNGFVIVANFIGLSEDRKEDLKNSGNYLIYEHDHKYLTTRDPSGFKNYVAPQEFLCNIEFYEKAKAVLCQSSLHSNIVKSNIPEANVENLSGNLWSLDTLKFISLQNKKDKKDRVSIWNSNNPIKDTLSARKFCIAKKYQYDLIGGLPYQDFLSEMSKNNCFVFFPTTVETLCRVVVEARMAGMKTITNKKLGAIGEPWFKLKGDELIEEMTNKRVEITQRILSYV
jgi:hypothetical protein